ncbi:hypothetical protein A3I48_03825 [Candidatus Daviesbacteria bacterium RIFCSPLOWO2_02_FULL_36_7]|uniref:Uncharacterized protein n=1 Tax=Candidatus Daviesbacteria bacterium RIFCSPLOWO2_02_FULL_36_7 TaxID=1797792 RepID=A0A1F5MFU6_9BACT|nr:MAG: hypothetical protein A3I48_03825 [Candidatus Daviesbacteria bacterium RIFCSPLOWO2_02_FULL_36_7]
MTEYDTVIEPILDEGKPVLSVRNGEPLFNVTTQRYTIGGIGTISDLKAEIIRKGRILRPIEQIADMFWFGGVCYTVGIGVNYQLHPSGESFTNQLLPGVAAMLVSKMVLSIYNDPISIWKSEKAAFDRHFSNDPIKLIPEKYHPLHFLKKVNPLQLLRRR